MFLRLYTFLIYCQSFRTNFFTPKSSQRSRAQSRRSARYPPLPSIPSASSSARPSAVPKRSARHPSPLGVAGNTHAKRSAKTLEVPKSFLGPEWFKTKPDQFRKYMEICRSYRSFDCFFFNMFFCFGSYDAWCDHTSITRSLGIFTRGRLFRPRWWRAWCALSPG